MKRLVGFSSSNIEGRELKKLPVELCRSPTYRYIRDGTTTSIIRVPGTRKYSVVDYCTKQRNTTPVRSQFRWRVYISSVCFFCLVIRRIPTFRCGAACRTALLCTHPVFDVVVCKKYVGTFSASDIPGISSHPQPRRPALHCRLNVCYYGGP